MNTGPDSASAALRPLVIGAAGQLGRALLSRSSTAIGVSRPEIDLAETETLAERLQAVLDANPGVDAVINAAAYTAVDKAESEPDIAHTVNADAPGIIAAVCAARGLPFIHVSTDYVFDGEAETPMTEDRVTAPISVYGLTKRDGETAVLDAGGRSAILRTSWVYGSTGANFMLTMLRLAQTRDTISVVEDQVGRPTHAGDLAEACLACAEGLRAGRDGGIYHVSNTGPATNWADFARAIFLLAGTGTQVVGIPSAAYPTPAARPRYSVMDTSAFEAAFGHALPDWRDSLVTALAERPVIRPA